MNNDRAREIFFEAFEGMPQLAPGLKGATQRAYRALDLPDEPRVLDVGCGVGRQTLDLAEVCPGTIVAVDNHEPFLEQLRRAAAEQGFAERIQTLSLDMAGMEFPDDSFDLIWSEGAIYNVGFADGLKRWRPWVAYGGCVAVTEVCWLRPDPPAPLRSWWQREYPAITAVDTNLRFVREAGFESLGHFALPAAAWTEAYYRPLQSRVRTLRTKYGSDSVAAGVLDMLQTEIDTYDRYGEWYGYVFFLMRRPHDHA